MAERLISEIGELDSHRDALAALGFTTVEELLGVVQVAAPDVARYLGISPADLAAKTAQVAPAAAAIPAAALAEIATLSYSLGVAVDSLPHLTAAPSFPATAIALTNQVSHIGDMPPIRNQQNRGTCVAHAALAMYEHFLNLQGFGEDLSEQFLYWDCKASDGIPEQPGTYLRVGVPLLQRDGCCREGTWPYNPNPILGNEGEGPPPVGAQVEALSFRLEAYQELAPTSVDDIRAALAAGHCVAFSIPVFASLFNPQVAFTGRITNPVPFEMQRGGHAMCMVGYADDPSSFGIGGGRFIIRNSWGQSWGINSAFGAGYGTIPYSYINRFGLEAFIVG